MKKKIGEIYNKPIVVGNKNEINKNEIHVDELFTSAEGGSGESGSGGSESKESGRNDINFFDYDGTLLYAYTWEEAKNLTQLPPLPVHDGLEVREWNYTLEDIKAQGTETTIGKADIGACVYDNNGEHVKPFGVYIFERGITKLEDFSNVVCAVISIPNTVTLIESSTFYRTSFICEVKFPISIEDIMDYYSAFNSGWALDTWWNGENRTLDYQCNYGKKMVIQEGVVSVKLDAGYIIYAIFPQTLNYIDHLGGINTMRVLNNFTKLKQVPMLNQSVFGHEINVVPDNLYDEWINATNWSEGADYIYKESELPWLNNI